MFQPYTIYVCHLMRRGIRFRNHNERVLEYRILAVNYLLQNININRRIIYYIALKHYRFNYNHKRNKHTGNAVTFTQTCLLIALHLFPG